MKRIAISMYLLAPAIYLSAQEEIPIKDSFLLLSPVEVRSIRAGIIAPFTKTNLTKEEIEKVNFGQDLPFILNQTPGVVVNSDAGNGVGYTGIRIRGSDATRINVTLNGIPYNDAESQGTFFVDLPDFSSSVNTIQVQRGVGTSSNGASAFGASINISTNEVNKIPYASFNNSYGSFNTWKSTLKAGTGLLGDHFTADLRLSRISSDGYIDRAKSSLHSFYFSTAYLNEKSTFRFNVFSGKEKTYQAWNGVSESDVKTNRRINYAGMEKPDEPYENETDNYTQDHYQFFIDHKFTPEIQFNTAFFLTHGNGYYEQYKEGEDYADYNLPYPVYGSTTITSTDLVRQLWLNNYYYGNIFSAQYTKKRTTVTVGSSITKYDGEHFGKVIWAENGLPNFDNYYDNNAFKNDFSFYNKWQQQVADKWYSFVDLQYRSVRYAIDGFRDNPGLSVDNRYSFFNPKAGITYLNKDWKAYASYSAGSKEPNREDFESSTDGQPDPEKLHDFEIGAEKKTKQFSYGITAYYMLYKNQLVLTGKINDVGAYTRTNIDDSYRTGIEMTVETKLSPWMNLQANLALSRNKVKNFTEFLDDYDAGGQKSYQYSLTDIAYSPSIVGGANLQLKPVDRLAMNLTSKYVGKQYLDNTQNENRKLNAFYTQDVSLFYSLNNQWSKNATLVLQVNNIFDKKYEPNGYTYSYIYGGELTTENFYFPMAGTNFMLALNITL